VPLCANLFVKAKAKAKGHTYLRRQYELGTGWLLLLLRPVGLRAVQSVQSEVVKIWQTSRRPGRPSYASAPTYLEVVKAKAKGHTSAGNMNCLAGSCSSVKQAEGAGGPLAGAPGSCSSSGPSACVQFSQFSPRLSKFGKQAEGRGGSGCSRRACIAYLLDSRQTVSTVPTDPYNEAAHTHAFDQVYPSSSAHDVCV
jgi:hypothetical protein